MEATKSGEATHTHGIEEVRVLKSRGPWRTRSQADLSVVLAIDFADVMDRFLSYQMDELARLPASFDIRGLRMYIVRGIPIGTIGGTEFHRIREEMVFCLNGAVEWMCEDLLGKKKKILLTPHHGVWMPSFILHTYSAEENGSDLLVLANTLFNPNDSRTHDTYGAEEFRALQKKSA